MPSPSEQRQARALASAPPKALEAAGLNSRGNSQTIRTTKDDSALPMWTGGESTLAARAEPEVASGGFEIIDDDDEADIIDLD